MESIVSQYWPLLIRGLKIDLAPGEMEDPRSRPDLFSRVVGWPVGQVVDYSWPLADRSRVHAQGFRRGGRITWRLHRDTHDPRDLEGTIKHIVFETPIPSILLLALAGTLTYQASRRPRT
ncbi:MAG: hypothetical protein R3B09_35760 [Nannocystaceae bacterium]